MSGSRVTAIIIVALLHAILGYAFVTGLAYNVVKKVAEDTAIFDVEEEPPPPEEEPPPPPPEDIPQVEPPPNVPPPLVKTNTAPPPIQTVANPNPQPVIFNPTPAPVAPVAQPAPPPPPPPPPPPQVKKVAAVAVKPRGNPASWATSDDYPSSALRAEEQGVTGFRLAVGADGRPTSCEVTRSSGSSALDDATCKLVMRRARFTPAKDDTGTAIASSYTNRITWQIPRD